LTRQTRLLSRSLAGMAGLGAGALAYATLIERRWYTLRHVTVPLLGTAAARPLRLLHVSDLHLLPHQRHRLDFVRSCVDHGPDIVIGTGDFLESDDAIDPVVETMAEVGRGRIGLAVLGSHDFWGARFKNPLDYLLRPHRRVYGKRLNTRRLVAGLTESGWEVLDNRRTLIDTPAGPLDVAGLGDPHVRYDRPHAVDWAAPQESVALRLGLVHAPYLRSVERFAGAGYDLVLAGHTHGGQVRAPLVGALVNNTDLPLRHSRGLSRPDGGVWLHVSAGLGHSRYAPFRFACRPEATILDLVPGPPEDRRI
jgi:uncharacterized protein